MEISQSISISREVGIKTYLKNTENILDYTGITIYFIYSVCFACTDYDYMTTQLIILTNLRMIATFLILVRGILSFFLLIESTRFIVQMVMQTLVDMVPFVSIVIATTFTFALMMITIE